MGPNDAAKVEILMEKPEIRILGYSNLEFTKFQTNHSLKYKS